jgi:UDP-N-acetyl-D-galactosamine dehydrogenase
MTLNNLKIGIIGLGYVGLPLAVEFGKHYSTTGFDLNQQRIQQLKAREINCLNQDFQNFRIFIIKLLNL